MTIINQIIENREQDILRYQKEIAGILLKREKYVQHCKNLMIKKQIKIDKIKQEIVEFNKKIR